MAERDNGDSERDATLVAAFDWVVRLEHAPDDTVVAAALRGWLAESPAHREAYDRVRAVWAAARHAEPAMTAQWGDLPPPAARSAGRDTTVVPMTRRAGRGPSRRRWLAGAGALAAGLALFAAAGGFGDLSADYATGTGETRAATLADGSRVQLDTDSAVRVSYGAGARTLELLRGRAWFDVTPDAARPFTVSAGRTQATVLGTRFDVGRDGDGVSVRVEEGRVAVSLDGRAVSPQGGLARGEAVRVDLHSGEARRMTVKPDAVAAWRRGQLVVENRAVAEVLDELGRYHRGVIVLQDEALGARRVSGFYDLARPYEAVRSVAEAQGGRVMRLSPWVLLVTGG